MQRLPFAYTKAALVAAVSTALLCAEPANSPVQELLLQVVVNGQAAGDFVSVLHVAGAGFYAPAEFFEAARLRLPAITPLRMRGREYYLITAIPGSRATLDAAEQRLKITVPGSAFVASIVTGSGQPRITPEISGVGLFLNHDFQVSGGATTAVSGMIEGGFFSSLGVLTSRFIARDLMNQRHPVRLETEFFHDFPDRMETVTVGDSISSSAPWARQVYYGGVRWASKFSTQPSFIPQALPAVSGEAVLPSVVDVYADNVRRLSMTVQPGPFSINNVPVLSSQGTIGMVVTDLMGRQQVITQAYSTSPQLLRKGVQEYTYEAGFIRHGYGLVSSGYRGIFADANVRRGLTDSFTVSARAELHPEGETGGIGADFKLPFLIAGGGAGASISHGRSGYLLYGELSHSSRALGLSANYQAATGTFRQLGLLAGERPEVRQLQTSVSRSLHTRVTAAAGYLRRDGRTNFDVRAVTASLNISTHRGLVMLAVNHSILKDRSVLFSLTFVLPVKERIAVSESLQSTGTRPESSTEVVRQLGINNGYGYRVKADTRNDTVEAGFSLQDSRGLSMIEVARAGAQTAWRAQHTGGLVLLGGHVIPSRWLTDSFAVVEMPPEAEGVQVSANNQPVAKVGSSGRALVPWLAAYEPNSIQIDPDALPIELMVAEGRKTIVPMPRTGVLVKFTPERNAGATVRLVMRDGRPVPPGARVTANGSTHEFLVAWRGEVFLPELETPAELLVRWERQSCRARVPKSSGRTLLPRLGPFVCVPETPVMMAAEPGQAPSILPMAVAPEGRWFALAIGAFEDRANAERLAARMRARQVPCRVIGTSGLVPFWRVIAGEKLSREEALQLKRRLLREFRGAFVIALTGAGEDADSVEQR
jgi:outer membrane usher protein